MLACKQLYCEPNKKSVLVKTKNWLMICKLKINFKRDKFLIQRIIDLMIKDFENEPHTHMQFIYRINQICFLNANNPNKVTLE